MIYFDNAATTTVLPEVMDSFVEAQKKFFANSSSAHHEGARSASIEKKAKIQVASFFNCKEDEVIFTSGATESNNLGIKGVAFRYQNRGKHIITSSIEHLSVINTCKQLEELFGFEVTYVDPDENGVVHVEDIVSAIREDTILVALMAVNNETGSIQSIEKLSKKLKEYPKIHFLCDATQAIGKININFDDVDLITLSGHKIHSFKAAGVLIKRSTTDIIPLITGGGHQLNMRSGTTNVPGEIALSKAIRIAFTNQKANYEHALILRNHLVEELNKIDGVILNSTPDCSPFIVSFYSGKKGSVVAEALSNMEIYVSTKSACSSKKDASSYVLVAMKKPSIVYENSLRISFSDENTLEEVDAFIVALKKVLSMIK